MKRPDLTFILSSRLCCNTSEDNSCWGRCLQQLHSWSNVIPSLSYYRSGIIIPGTMNTVVWGSSLGMYLQSSSFMSTNVILLKPKRGHGDRVCIGLAQPTPQAFCFALAQVKGRGWSDDGQVGFLTWAWHWRTLSLLTSWHTWRTRRCPCTTWRCRGCSRPAWRRPGQSCRRAPQCPQPGPWWAMQCPLAGSLPQHLEHKTWNNPFLNSIRSVLFLWH